MRTCPDSSSPIHSAWYASFFPSSMSLPPFGPACGWLCAASVCAAGLASSWEDFGWGGLSGLVHVPSACFYIPENGPATPVGCSCGRAAQ